MTSVTNLSNEFTSTYQALDLITLENSRLGQQAILNAQKNMDEQTNVLTEALDKQSNVYLAVCAIGILCLAGAIVGAALKKATPAPAAKADTGNLTFQRVPTTSFAKITEAARDALIKSHKRLPGLARTIEGGSQAVTNRFKKPEITANAIIRRKEMEIQQAREDNAHRRSAAEELDRLRNSIANNESASMRVGG